MKNYLTFYQGREITFVWRAQLRSEVFYVLQQYSADGLDCPVTLICQWKEKKYERVPLIGEKK